MTIVNGVIWECVEKMHNSTSDSIPFTHRLCLRVDDNDVCTLSTCTGAYFKALATPVHKLHWFFCDWRTDLNVSLSYRLSCGFTDGPSQTETCSYVTAIPPALEDRGPGILSHPKQTTVNEVTTTADYNEIYVFGKLQSNEWFRFKVFFVNLQHCKVHIFIFLRSNTL